MPVPRIDLVPVYGELHDGRPDYSIRAGETVVGRIYQQEMANRRVAWFWGLNGVVAGDLRVPMTGLADDLPSAKQRLREVFDRWLEWALAVPGTHPSFQAIDRQLRLIGARR